MKSQGKQMGFKYRDVKTPVDWADLMGRGRLFQSLGTAAARTRSPLLFLLVKCRSILAGVDGVIMPV